MRKVIYTCLVGKYEELLQPLVIDPTFDYICFSNDITENKIGVWKILPIPCKISDNIRLSRYVKLLPHNTLSNYDYSLWLDANIQITGQELYNIFNEKVSEGGLIYQVPHLFPPEDCVYDEIRHAYLCGRCGIIETLEQYIYLKKSAFPNHFGLFENNIILRKHNDSLVIKISEGWWDEFSHYTKRDQFSLMYLYWKNNFYPNYLFGKKQNARNVDFLCWQHHAKDRGPHSLYWKLHIYYRLSIRKIFVHLFNIVDRLYMK